MASPHRTTGSLCPAFAPGRLVGLTVKHPYAIALYARLPFVLRVPWEASVTLLEATTPVKLPTKRCLPCGVRIQIHKGQYFNVDSTIPSGTASQSPAYPTHYAPKFSVKLQ